VRLDGGVAPAGKEKDRRERRKVQLHASRISTPRAARERSESRPRSWPARTVCRLTTRGGCQIVSADRA
jgi:hypothetical protein